MCFAVQHATWMASHKRYNNSKNPSISSNLTKAKYLWSDAQKNCTSYKAGCKVVPAITKKTSCSNDGASGGCNMTLKGDSYVTTLQFSLDHFGVLPIKNDDFNKKYKVTITGTGADKVKVYNGSTDVTGKATNATKLTFKVPSSAITGTSKVSYAVILTATKKVWYISQVKEYYKKSDTSDQDISTYTLASTTPSYSFNLVAKPIGITITKKDK